MFIDNCSVNLLQLIPCEKRRSRCHQKDSILASRVQPLLRVHTHSSRDHTLFTF